MYTPFISIIVPVYKVEFYLRQCIESIINQAGNFELILINDGSPDRCPEICDEYALKDNRIQVIHKQNGGVSSARNAGLDIARGEWIWFVDSDDIVDISHLDKIIHWLQKHKEVDYVLMDMTTFENGKTPETITNKEDLHIEDSDGNKQKFLLTHQCSQHQRIFYKKKIMHLPSHSSKELRFTNGLRACEDGEFQFKFLMLCKHPVRIYYNIYYYRKRPGSATQSLQSRKNVVEDTQKVLHNYLDFMKKNNIPLELWLKIRIEGTMKILLYSSYISKDYKSRIFQTNIRNIIKAYQQEGHQIFTNTLFKLAYLSVPLYCTLLKLNLKLKGINI